MRYFIKRFAETAAITVVSSFTVFIILLLNIIPLSKLTYFAVFGFSAAIFYVLNIKSLRSNLIETESVLKYLVYNTLIFLVFSAASFVGLKYFTDYVYTAFFGFTKTANALGFSKEWSTFIFWAVYYAEILYFPIEKAVILRKK